MNHPLPHNLAPKIHFYGIVPSTSRSTNGLSFSDFPTSFLRGCSVSIVTGNGITFLTWGGGEDGLWGAHPYFCSMAIGGVPFPGKERLKREADHSPLSRLAETCLHSPIRLHGVVLD
jgi:hypothetical protein